MAGLIAHEYVHIDKQHGLRSLGRSLGYDIFTAVFVNGDLSERVFKESNMLLNLEYSREFEKEADLEALSWLEKVKINPEGMVSLMKRMHMLSENSLQSPRLSTHPLTIDRIEYLEEAIEKNSYEFEENETLNNIFQNLKK